MDYSDTVNLPDTSFSMKAKLAENEPERLRDWTENDLYDRIQANREDAEPFILHDGPPYANGDIHIGHALNKILKDILVKFKTMRGFRAPYRPGWDCHGLPIEHKVTTEQPETVEAGQLAIREACRKYALNYVDVQKDQFKRLGVLGEWDNPYLTLTHEYESNILESFRTLVQRDFVYRQLKPIHWCWECETALAEAEVEYKNLTSPAVYVDFPVIDDPQGVLESDSANFMIWTTTPWTLPANVAIAVHPDYSYVEIEDPNGEVHVLSERLLAATLDRKQWSTGDVEILQKIEGNNLEGIGTAHPFIDDRGSQVVLSEIVTLEQGTGCVHIAPGHGQEDYAIGMEYDLPVRSPVNREGRFTDEFSPEQGTHVLTAQDQIIEGLREDGFLFHQEDVDHSYPFCWRCKKPIIFRATPQWFLDVDHNHLRDEILDVLDEIRWLPERGQKRFQSMIEDRPDWCLSRQRAWGVPIPAVECKKCDEAFLNDELMQNLIETVREKGVDIWFDGDLDEFAPDGMTCPDCGSTDFRKQDDILDVWFDSGVSHQAVLQNDPDLQFPADVYLEGSDQHRGWFQLSMIPSMALEDSAPFNEVITHGFVVDQNGEKMSKSQGNVVSPQDVVSEDGADILRLWVASENYQEDLVLGDELLDQVRDKYRRIRNTFKFFLGNLMDFDDFDPDEDSLAPNELKDVDRWFLTELYGLVRRVSRAYQERKFHKAINEINNFCAVEASSLFLDIAKDRLYCDPPNSDSRRSAQTALYTGLSTIARLIAPVLSFTADEVWDYMPEEDSIHLCDWPEARDEWVDDSLVDDFNTLREARKLVTKKIEESDSVDDSNEAFVRIGIPSGSSTLSAHENLLAEWFIVADVELDTGADEKYVNVELTDTDKCERCWRYRASVKNRPELDGLLCGRCHEYVSDSNTDNSSIPEV